MLLILIVMVVATAAWAQRMTSTPVRIEDDGVFIGTAGRLNFTTNITCVSVSSPTPGIECSSSGGGGGGTGDIDDVGSCSTGSCFQSQAGNQVFASPDGTSGVATFRALVTADLANDLVTYAKIQNVTTDRLLGRDTALSGDVEELTVSGGIEFTGGPGIQRSALTGDVTASAGSNATTIANDAVSFAKMANLATDTLVGRDTTGTGDPEALSVSGGLEFTGAGGIQRSALTGDVTASAGSNATTIANNAVSDAKLRDSAGVSVIGRSANSIGDPADIAAGADGDVLRRAAGAVGFGAIPEASVTNLTTDLAAKAPVGAEYVVSSADATLTAERVVTNTATVTWDAGTAAQLKANVPDDAVTDAKLRNSAATSVIGRSAGTTGDPADIAASGDGDVLRRASGTLGFGAIPESSVTNLTTDLAGKAPVGSDFLTGSSDATLTAERVVTGTATVTWDLATGGQAKANVPDDAITDAKLRNAAATSVIGRSAGTTGDPADIAATGDGDVLRRASGTLGFGAIPESSVTNLTTDLASKAPVGAQYLVSASDATLTAERVTTDTATVTWDAGTAAQIKANVPDNAITYAKIQDVAAASKLLGRGDSGAGDPQEITLGTNLSMSGTTLNASGGGISDGDKGDITVSGSGATWTVDNDVVTDAKLRNSAGVSVIGRSANSTGDPADIAASADQQFLMRRSSVVGFNVPESTDMPNHASTVNVKANGVDCTGTSDATSAMQTVLTNNAGKTIYIPSGCIVRLASPGAGNAALSIPNNTKLYCEDQSAGFAAARRRCVGGTYGEASVPASNAQIGASCVTSGSSECAIGSGSCAYDFGSTVFAPTGGSTYTMLKDADSKASDITIENCSFWTFQADPYQRCTGGTGGNVGLPCRQECIAGSIIPGANCENDADAQCTLGGTCLRRADCAGSGGTGTHTCSGVPISSSGAGKIIPLDLARTFNARIINVSVYDHFSGDWSIKTAEQATIRDTNVAREITDCTTPLPGSTPATSWCWTNASSGALSCCYGGHPNNNANTEPTTAVTNGVVTGANSQLIRVFGRGSTAAISSGDYSRLDECTAWPPWSRGPGTAGGGYVVGALGQVAKSQALNLGSGTIGIDLNGTGSSAIENRLAGSYATGIKLRSANSHAIANNITGLTGTAVGIELGGSYDEARGNYIEGTGTGPGISVLSAASNASVPGNQIVSSAVDTLETAIKIVGNAVIADGNQIIRPKLQGIWWNAAGDGAALVNNNIHLSTSPPTTTLKPYGILMDGAGAQSRVSGNYIVNGWRGIVQGTGTSSLVNTNVENNRLYFNQGAGIALGGAGILITNNYINEVNTYLSCDPSCTGGNGRGAFCNKDSECTSCASTNACVPEPVLWVGNPMNATPGGTYHQGVSGNIIFTSSGATTKQCSTVQNGGALGQRCTVGACASGNCNANADGIGVCATGGALCCSNNGGTGTCTQRSPQAMIRPVIYGATATSHTNLDISNNQVFMDPSLSTYTNLRGVDFVGSGGLGTNLTLVAGKMVGNLFQTGSANTGTQAVAFQTAGANPSNFNINGNNFIGWATDVANYKGAFGEVSFTPFTVAVTSDVTNNTTSYANITGLAFPVDANKTYNFRCDIIFTSAATTTGIGISFTAPASPTNLVLYMTTPITATGGTAAVFDDFVAAADTIEPSTGTASGTNFARMEGILDNGANAGTLQARFRSEVGTSTITVKPGSSCIMFQVPKGT